MWVRGTPPCWARSYLVGVVAVEFDVVVVELEPVTPGNYEETLELAVTADQSRLIASVTKSLADAFVWHALARVARHEGAVIGFVLVYPFELEGENVANIVRFMIDQRHQRLGLGRAMLSSTLDWMAELEPRPQRVRVSTFPENEPALRLFRSAGFVGSKVENGEVVLWRAMPRPGRRH